MRSDVATDDLAASAPEGGKKGGGREIILRVIMAAILAPLGAWACWTGGLALTMAVVFLPVWLVAEWVAHMPLAVGLTVFLLFFVGGWVFQLVGHVFEGRKPALVDNFLQVLIAPMFLAAEVYFALGLRSELKAEVERLVPQHLPRQGAALQAG